MHLPKSIGMIVVAAVMMTGFAHAESMSQDDMAKELAALRKEVAQLKAQNESDWLTERRAEEVKSLISEVLNDAETRASLLDSSLVAGHKKYFFLASSDGKYLLQMAGQFQGRYIANFRSDVGNGVGIVQEDNDVAGFQMSRIKLKFFGHIADPKFTYKVILSSDRDNINTYTQEAWTAYKFDNGIEVKFGRFKAPFLREELTDAAHQLAVERSFVNEKFTVGITEGIQASYEGDMFKVAAMINDGYEAGEPTGPADFNAEDTDLAITARVDVKLAGDWGQMADFTAWDGEEMAAFVGAAIHWNQDESGTNNDELHIFSWTVDGSLEYQRWNLYAAVIGAHEDVHTVAAAVNEGSPYGWLVQGGYQILMEGQSIEPFVRFEQVAGDSSVSASTSALALHQNFITGGVNWYIKKHAAKFTFDIVYAMDQVLSNETKLGILADTANQEDQLAVRTQFQLLW